LTRGLDIEASFNGRGNGRAVLVFSGCSLSQRLNVAIRESTLMPLLTLGILMLLLGRLWAALLSRRLTPESVREVFLDISRWLSMPMQLQDLRSCAARYKRTMLLGDRKPSE
jgi:hypothetical protein